MSYAPARKRPEPGGTQRVAAPRIVTWPPWVWPASPRSKRGAPGGSSSKSPGACVRNSRAAPRAGSRSAVPTSAWPLHASSVAVTARPLGSAIDSFASRRAPVRAYAARRSAMGTSPQCSQLPIVARTSRPGAASERQSSWSGASAALASTASPVITQSAGSRARISAATRSWRAPNEERWRSESCAMTRPRSDAGRPGTGMSRSVTSSQRGSISAASRPARPAAQQAPRRRSLRRSMRRAGIPGLQGVNRATKSAFSGHGLVRTPPPRFIAPWKLPATTAEPSGAAPTPRMIWL